MLTLGKLIFTIDQLIRKETRYFYLWLTLEGT